MTSRAEDERIGVAVLGSTGSVGRQTLDVIDALADRFRIVSLAAGSPSDLFVEQVTRYAPEVAAVADSCDPLGSYPVRLLHGPGGLLAAATVPSASIVVVATSGHAAIAPTMQAIAQGKTIALANKETLVCAGEIIVPLAARHDVSIRPVDSEHSAIWQALATTPGDQVQRIILTASGGPFRTLAAADLAAVTVADALAHPTWAMGGKITIDSATLMNKGLEIIEAHWLFALPYDRIDVLVHPESIVHSLVEFVDGSLIGQLGLPDMRLPIQYALTYPERVEQPLARLDLAAVGTLHFEPPNLDRFPALHLAKETGVAGRTYPTVLSAADDVAVAAFLAGEIRFIDIVSIVQDVVGRHVPAPEVTLESITEADAWARRVALETIRRLRKRE
jgi:1-deoxy-D-xylulose-5-phosphate reductoisomerase